MRILGKNAYPERRCDPVGVAETLSKAQFRTDGGQKTLFKASAGPLWGAPDAFQSAPSTPSSLKNALQSALSTSWRPEKRSAKRWTRPFGVRGALCKAPARPGQAGFPLDFSRNPLVFFKKHN